MVALRACSSSSSWPRLSQAVSFPVWFSHEACRLANDRLVFDFSSSWPRLSQAVSFPVWFLPGSILANDLLLPGVAQRPRRTKARSPRAVPWEIDAPVGCRHGNPKDRRRTSPRRPRPRLCLRKGCGRKYQPRRWNQRYCQDPECRRLVRRWQAARRQARRRQDDAAKAQHAAAQRARRQRGPSAPQASNNPEVAPARGHAAKIILPTRVCDRPGCYEPPSKPVDQPACFCSPACRQAVRRVQDRERKWRSRGTFQGRRARAQEYAAARARRSGQRHGSARATPPAPPPP